MDQMCESMDKNRIQGASAGRAGNLPRSPYPSRMRSVDPAAVHGRRLSLPQEICSVSLRRLRLSKGGLTAEQKWIFGDWSSDFVMSPSDMPITRVWRSQPER